MLSQLLDYITHIRAFSFPNGVTINRALAPAFTFWVLSDPKYLTRGSPRLAGFRSARRTKIVCTIGPATETYEQLERLASNGMNVARLNMCHGTHAWHRRVIRALRKLNEEKGYSVAIMCDTEGSEIHTGDLKEPIALTAGDAFTFTVRHSTAMPCAEREGWCVDVSYDGFAEDVRVGDTILAGGGLVSWEVVDKAGPDVVCRCVEPGLLTSRANLTFRRGGKIIRARNAMLPVISQKDWLDIDFAVAEGADFLAISFVKSAETMAQLRSYLSAKGPEAAATALVAKIESMDAIPNLGEIVEASDGVMVARGDLGSQVPLEDVPVLQKQIARLCRQAGKPCMVASHFLQSMLEFPTPTRAEVADIADALRQKSDAVVLCGETALGAFPHKALDVVRSTSVRVEQWCRDQGLEDMLLRGLHESKHEEVSEKICAAGASLANELEASAIFVYTKSGYMAGLLSRQRPDCPIFAFTDSPTVRRKMNLRWGLIPFRMALDGQAEHTVDRSFRLLLARGLVSPGDLVVVVSDMGAGSGSDASGGPNALFSVDDEGLDGFGWEEAHGNGASPGVSSGVRSIQVRYVPQPLASGNGEESVSRSY